MPRAFIVVMDSLGIGSTPDAQRFGDVGANTLGHIAAQQRLHLPTLDRLGLGAAARLATGDWVRGLEQRDGFEARYAAARERSLGKDTPSGHWEMCGVPVDTDWGYFPQSFPCFPEQFIREWLGACGLGGALGQAHASGTEVITRLGDEHLRTGWPIVYTSADSVFQVAAHEEHFGLQRLYEICETAFDLLTPWRIARVIARPFRGEAGAFVRTGNRRDFAVAPPEPTLLDTAHAAGRDVIAIGKISDIFAHRGIGTKISAHGHDALMQALQCQVHEAANGAIVFVNFVEFDQSWGHRRDVAGYATGLNDFDRALAALLPSLGADDLLVLTADHGCDPTWPGTDHTREHVPQLFYQPGRPGGSRGVRTSFCDLGQTVAAHLGLPALARGVAIT
jgi:phosphopentomutase